MPKKVSPAGKVLDDLREIFTRVPWWVPVASPAHWGALSSFSYPKRCRNFGHRSPVSLYV